MKDSRKTLLVLAASLYQLDTIRTAQRLGYRVVTTDNRPENPGHAVADVSYGIDTTDCEAVLELARREKIDGILAPSTDVALPTVAHVSTALGLPGPPPEISWIVFDKLRFRRFLAERNFALPAFHALHAGAHLGDELFDGRRWILKPSQSSGSKGTVVVQSAAELNRALPEALAFSKAREAVLEQFIDGHQGTCEGWLQNGEIVWHCLLDRQTAALPHVTTAGHRFPTSLSPYRQELAVDAIARIWRELRVKDGPFDCDYVVDDNAAYVIELSPRLGGNAIPRLVQLACRFDLVARTVRWACGDSFEASAGEPSRAAAVLILGVPTAGQLRYDREEATRLRAEPWVDDFEWDVEHDTNVRAFIDSRHRVGQAMLHAGDRAALDARVDEFHRRLQLRAR